MADANQVTLRPTVVAGTLHPRVGGEIPFQRVLLELRTEGPEEVENLLLKLEARQGDEVICEVEERLEGALGPRAVRQWDLYDLFLEKGRGFPSKVHLFGIKAALGWNFTVRAEVFGSGTGARTAFRFAWSGDQAGPITAEVEDLP